MTWLTFLLPLSIVIATGTLAGAYVLGGQVAAAFALGTLGIIWLLLSLLHKYWVANPVFACLIAFTFVGSLLDFNIVVLWAAILALLVAWDLSHFVQRIRYAERVEDFPQALRQHFLRLGGVLVVGGMFSMLALQLRVRLGFAVAVLLSLLAAIGLAQAVAFFRRESP